MAWYLGAAALMLLAFGTYMTASCGADWDCSLGYYDGHFGDERPREDWSWMPLGRVCVYPDETVTPGWGITVAVALTSVGAVGLLGTRRLAFHAPRDTSTHPSSG